MFKRLGAFFLDVLEVVVFAIGIFFFVYLLIMRPHKIKGQSMMPNFPDSEFLLTEKVSYYLHEPARGDVVVLIPPASVSTTDEFIKRVIALPGEKISIQDGRVHINDNLLAESYLKEDVVTGGGPFLTDGRSYVIPDGQYFVMGDNRPNSSDSRYWGPITKKEMTGRAWIIYWPIKNVGVVPKPNYN
jgi:signal peptidase I